MKKILFILFFSNFALNTSYAHHGPFFIDNDKDIHELHLGLGETINQTGELRRFGIRACNTRELDFVNPTRLAQKGTIPFKVKTEEIVAFGLTGSINSNNRSLGGKAVGAITNPLSIPLSVFSKGGRNTFQYSIYTLNNKNGRISHRAITLLSQADVNYLNNYLKKSTGYNPNEQLTNEELKNKYQFITKNKNFSKQKECSYMEKYGQIRSKKKNNKKRNI